MDRTVVTPEKSMGHLPDIVIYRDDNNGRTWFAFGDVGDFNTKVVLNQNRTPAPPNHPIQPYISPDLRRAAELAGVSVKDFLAMPGSATAHWYTQVRREKAGLPLEKIDYPFRVIGDQES